MLAGVLASVWNACRPVVASIAQQTLLNLPRSRPRIVAYPMQSSSGKKPPPIVTGRRRDCMGSLERTGPAVYFLVVANGAGARPAAERRSVICLGVLMG